MSSEGESIDISSEISNQEELIVEEVPLLVFRIMGSTVVTLLVGLTIILYITTGMLHVDCLAQICCEICIFAAYMLILLTTTEPFRIDTGMCVSIAVFLHFLFVGAAFFLLLEALCVCHARNAFFHRTLPVQLSTRNILIAGWVFPALLTGISAILWSKEYTTKRNCWLNANQSPYWPTMIPMVLCASTHFLLIMSTLIPTEIPRSHSEVEYKRFKCFRTTRWASFLISLVLAMCWFFGVGAYHSAREDLFGAFTVSSILLGVCVFILRISTDDEMREKVTENALCCLVQKNKVQTFASKNSLSKKDYTNAILNSMSNGNLVERHNEILANHR
ncbi:hypothetical protein JTE90_011803 [Oedothorax gibbosus]|uniref:G-protein coupled receptors family 2 profile 2 domain-containing protein n=1 Tax=Oedothorax gibbosus TaxID=931172 RepID=A0AAV6VU89_9ARAC|nr:hypothetical protein JTE90_011803 [Oedothorax gibbosus]